MLRYIYGSELGNYPLLKDTMFLDRADQFARRLNWDVKVDTFGHERDEYDALNPLYVIWQLENGCHGGSMRFMPTVGPTMVQDHFSHLTDGVRIESPLIWECTRFCLAPKAPRQVASGLVLAAGELMENFHLSHFIGVFDPSMERIYSRIGLNPDVIGSTGPGTEQIGVGLWGMDKDAWPGILARVGVSRETSKAWFQNAFVSGPKSPVRKPEFV